jgi:hypothetical protein
VDGCRRLNHNEHGRNVKTVGNDTRIREHTLRRVQQQKWKIFVLKETLTDFILVQKGHTNSIQTCDGVVITFL